MAQSESSLTPTDQPSRTECMAQHPTMQSRPQNMLMCTSMAAPHEGHPPAGTWTQPAAAAHHAMAPAAQLEPYMDVTAVVGGESGSAATTGLRPKAPKSPRGSAPWCADHADRTTHSPPGLGGRRWRAHARVRRKLAATKPLTPPPITAEAAACVQGALLLAVLAVLAACDAWAPPPRPAQGRGEAPGITPTPTARRWPARARARPARSRCGPRGGRPGCRSSWRC